MIMRRINQAGKMEPADQKERERSVIESKMENKIAGASPSELIIYKIEAEDTIRKYRKHKKPAVEKMTIGFFDSLPLCEETITEYKKLPGFSLPCCTFTIMPYRFSVPEQTTIEYVYYVQICAYEFSRNEKDYRRS